MQQWLSPVHKSLQMNPEREGKVPRHVWHMNEVIQREIVMGLQTGKGSIVLISMPPGHIKSDTCSVHLPEWFLDVYPDKRVMIAAYGYDKAMEWGLEDKIE